MSDERRTFGEWILSDHADKVVAAYVRQTALCSFWHHIQAQPAYAEVKALPKDDAIAALLRNLRSDKWGGMAVMHMLCELTGEWPGYNAVTEDVVPGWKGFDVEAARAEWLRWADRKKEESRMTDFFRHTDPLGETSMKTLPYLLFNLRSTLCPTCGTPITGMMLMTPPREEGELPPATRTIHVECFRGHTLINISVPLEDVMLVYEEYAEWLLGKCGHPASGDPESKIDWDDPFFKAAKRAAESAAKANRLDDPHVKMEAVVTLDDDFGGTQTEASPPSTRTISRWTWRDSWVDRWNRLKRDLRRLRG